MKLELTICKTGACGPPMSQLSQSCSGTPAPVFPGVCPSAPFLKTSKKLPFQREALNRVKTLETFHSLLPLHLMRLAIRGNVCLNLPARISLSLLFLPLTFVCLIAGHLASRVNFWLAKTQKWISSVVLSPPHFPPLSVPVRRPRSVLWLIFVWWKEGWSRSVHRFRNDWWLPWNWATCLTWFPLGSSSNPLWDLRRGSEFPLCSSGKWRVGKQRIFLALRCCDWVHSYGGVVGDPHRSALAFWKVSIYWGWALVRGDACKSQG